jgi:antitoxin component of RelBE/YafQ-DinJ toxin-antitoxin module
MKENRTETCSIRLDKKTKQYAKIVASQDDRTLSSWVETLVKKELKKHEVPGMQRTDED